MYPLVSVKLMTFILLMYQLLVNCVMSLRQEMKERKVRYYTPYYFVYSNFGNFGKGRINNYNQFLNYAIFFFKSIAIAH